MTDSETLLALADRCEKATGPDRELNAAIKEALGHSWDYAADWGPRGKDAPVAKPYTASLDAAMSLVPEGWEPIIDCRRTVEVQLETIAVDPETLDPRKVYATGVTPALALCAASLRALATLDLDGEKA